MKKEENKKFGLDIQLFAEDDQEENSKNTKATDEEETSSKETSKKDTKTDEVKKYSDEEVNAIIDRKFASWQKKHETELSEAKKLENMNAEERADHERKKLEKENAELKREKEVVAMSKQARKMLSDEHINIGDELLGVLVAEDADGTKETVTSFISMFKEAVEDAVKERLKGKTPSGGKGKASLTREQIMAIPDSAARQKAIAENIDKFD